RQPLRRTEPGGGIGRDAHEGGLPEGQRAAYARHEDKAYDHQGGDADVVEQGNMKAAQYLRHDDDQQQHQQRHRVFPDALRHSSLSSSWWTTRPERITRIGISRPNTIASFRPLFQKDA